MPSIQSTGGIFLRLDSSGNLNVYDTTGTSIAKFTAGAYSAKLNRGTFVSSTPINTTTSTTYVYLGASLQITVQSSGNVLIVLNTTASNLTASDGASIIINRTTGANNPAGGGALSGTNLSGTTFTNNANTASLSVPVAFILLDTGLTAGTTYTYSIAVRANTGGTFSFTGTGIDNTLYSCFEI